MSSAGNVVRLINPALIDEMVCIGIGHDLIEKCGTAEKALHEYPSHSAEIILADILIACRSGETGRQIEGRLTNLVVVFEDRSIQA